MKDDPAIGSKPREPLNNSLHAQSFRLVRPLGQGKEGRGFDGVCPSIEKAQQRVRASLEDPKGAAWSAHLLRLASRKGNHPYRRVKTQQLHAPGHAEHARSYSEAPLVYCLSQDHPS